MGDLSVAEVLDRAADLIEPEGAWTQNTYARRVDGVSTDTMSDDAMCFCIAGAIARTLGESNRNSLRRTMQIRSLGLVPVIGKYVASFNDDPSRTQAEVVAKLREAAALARESGK